MLLAPLLSVVLLAPIGEPVPLATPAGPGGAWSVAMGGRLVAAGQALWVSWVESDGERARLCYAQVGADGPGAPRVAAEGTGWLLNWADYPVLAVGPGGAMAATWPEFLEGGAGYGARVAVSADGETWGAPAWLHDDLTGPEYGFVSLVPDGDGFGALWLDGRAMASGDDHGHGGGDMALVHRRVGLAADGPELGPELVLDPRTCECCATSAVAGPDGGLEVAYRDRSAEELRDLGVLALGGAHTFAAGGPAPDRWEIPGCPVNGPDLTRRGALRGLAWFTMGTGALRAPGAAPTPPTPSVRVALSRDGLSYGTGRAVDEGRPLGRACAAFDGAGRLHVAWLEAAEEPGRPARWLLRQVTGPDGAALDELPPARVLTEVPGSRSSGFADLAWRAGERPGLVFVCTRPGEGASTLELLLVPDAAR